jgi:hypothetical protein
MKFLTKTLELTELQLNQPVRAVFELTPEAAEISIKMAEANKKPKMWRNSTKEEIETYHEYHKTGPYAPIDEVAIEKSKARELDKKLATLNLKKENEAKLKQIAELEAAEKKQIEPKVTTTKKD